VHRCTKCHRTACASGRSRHGEREGDGLEAVVSLLTAALLRVDRLRAFLEPLRRRLVPAAAKVRDGVPSARGCSGTFCLCATAALGSQAAADMRSSSASDPSASLRESQEPMSSPWSISHLALRSCASNSANVTGQNIAGAADAHGDGTTAAGALRRGTSTLTAGDAVPGGQAPEFASAAAGWSLPAKPLSAVRSADSARWLLSFCASCGMVVEPSVAVWLGAK